MTVFGARTRGPFAPYFWGMVLLNFAAPFVLLGIRRLRTRREDRELREQPAQRDHGRGRNVGSSLHTVKTAHGAR